MTYDPRKGGVQKITDTSSLTTITNPQDGDLALTLDDDLIKRYDSASSSWKTAVNNFIDPAQFGNWVLVDATTLNAQTANYTVTGDFNCRIRVTFEGQATVAGQLSVSPNGDTSTANYYRSYLMGSDATVSATTFSAVWAGYLLANAATGKFLNEIEANLVNNGLVRLGRSIQSSTAAIHDGIFTCYWNNTTSNVTSLLINGTGTYSGVIKIYKWQELRATELATYKLLKTYRLNSQNLNDTIPIDSNSYSNIVILTNVKSNSADGSMMLLINGDSGSSYNYETYYFTASAIVNNYGTATSMNIGNLWSNATTPYSECFTECKLSIPTGNVRAITTGCGGQFYSGAKPAGVYNTHARWMNTTTPVTSLTIMNTAGNLISGLIQVYAIIPTQLLDTAINRIQDTSSLSSFTGGSLWDGKLAYCLNQSQLVGYRSDTSSWVNLSRRDFTDRYYNTNQNLYAYDYAMMDLTTAVTLTFPTTPNVGDVIFILDLPKNFHIYNCSINLNGTLCNGQSGTVILDTPGEYKFKYTGATYGWRMIRYA